MQGRDGLFGTILEHVTNSVEEADAKEAKIQGMVAFYAKMIEGNTAYASIVKIAEENEMTPEDVFALLKEGGHTKVESLAALKEADETEEPAPEVEEDPAPEEVPEEPAPEVEEKIGEPKAPTAPKGGDAGSIKQMDAMGASTKHATDQINKMGGPSSPKAKIGEPSPEKPPEVKTKGGADHSSLKQIDGLGATVKNNAKEGISPHNINDLKEEDQIKTLTESDIAKDVAALVTAATKALQSGEYDEALDLVSRLSQVKMVLPAKLVTPPKKATPKPEEDKKEDTPPIKDTPPVVDNPCDED